MMISLHPSLVVVFCHVEFEGGTWWDTIRVVQCKELATDVGRQINCRSKRPVILATMIRGSGDTRISFMIFIKLV